MAEPTIPNGEEQFNTVTYSGNGSSPRSITGVEHQPDFIWIKDRVAANTNVLVDSSRGAGSLLYSNSTVAAVTGATQVSSFNTDGFTLGATTYVNENSSSNTYVAWNWKINGGTTVANSVGAIASTVQANQTAGFSILEYTGSGGAASIGHGLSKAPEVIWIKDKGNSTNWRCWHVGFGNITTYQKLNSDDGYGSASMWGSPTSSAIIVGGTGYEVNESGNNYIAYCWHGVDGFSKFGRFSGNNNANGPFIYTGFKPAFVMIKGYTIGNNWIIWDNKRSVINPCDNVLYPDLDQAEATSGNDLDFLSNGFKCRGTNSNYNGSYDYLYWAWAEHPFVGDGISPVTAR
tara:strand:- start:43 stop:1080 length:1038 start_codon:yes stop_codon:yes gene_type:complete